jgi:hypothetical protein
LHHREGTYWCSAPLRDEDQCNYKVRDAADVQAAPTPPVDEYVSYSTVGGDDKAPAMSFRAPSKVAAPRRTRQTAGKVSASRTAASITTTQTAEAKKKKKRKRTRSTVSVDTATVSSNIETIDVDDEEGDVESPSATVAPSVGTPRRAVSPVKQAVETPRQISTTQEHPRLGTDTIGDLGSHKRVKKAPPKACKAGFRSATK